MEHLTVHRAERAYASFPSVDRTEDGTFVTVFREAGQATADAALDGSHTHQDNDSRILLRRADATGRVWSEPELVYESDRYAASDPSVLVRRDGTWLVRFARWTLVPSRERHRLRAPISRHYVQTGQVGVLSGNGYVESRDAGGRWQSLACEVLDEPWRDAVSREAPLELDDGTLVQAVYGGYPQGVERAALLRSFDDGLTWGDAAKLAGDFSTHLPYRGNVSFNEVSLAEIGASTLVALVRCDTTFITDEGTFVTEGGMGEVHWTISHDAGMTWAPTRPTGLWGQPAHALHIGDGRVVCTFGHRRRPFGVQAALARVSDAGFEIERRIILRDDAASWDCGYPCSARIDEEEILSVYYIHGRDGIRHIAATCWRTDEMERA